MARLAAALSTRCKTTVRGDKLDVAFVSFKDGSTLNRFGVREYAANQPLFALTRRGNAIATTWQGYNRERHRHGRSADVP